MKKLSIQIFLFIFVCVFGSSITAQEKPQVLEFAQINLKSSETEIKVLTETLEKFISRLEKEPETTKGFINIAGNSKTAEEIKSFISENSDLVNRIVFNWNLKYPKISISDIGFYIIPQGSEIPYVNVHEPVLCPTLTVDAPAEVTEQNSVIIFTAKISGGGKDAVSTYNWKVSAGKIIEGQGTATIKVNAGSAKEVMATVEIGGVCEECLREASFTSRVQKRPVADKIADYNDDTGKIQLLAEASNKFAEQLAKEPLTTKGFIAYYRGSSYLNSYEKRYGEIFDYLSSFLKQSKSSIKERIKLEWGGRSLNRSDLVRVEFWIVPKDAENPDIRTDECALCICPEIEIQGKELIEDSSKLQIFAANVIGRNADGMEYNWKVSSGEIVSGQGTPFIEVNFSKAKTKEIKITIEVDGICEECVQEYPFTTKIQ